MFKKDKKKSAIFSFKMNNLNNLNDFLKNWNKKIFLYAKYQKKKIN